MKKTLLTCLVVSVFYSSVSAMREVPPSMENTMKEIESLVQGAVDGATQRLNEEIDTLKCQFDELRGTMESGLINLSRRIGCQLYSKAKVDIFKKRLSVLEGMLYDRGVTYSELCELYEGKDLRLPEEEEDVEEEDIPEANGKLAVSSSTESLNLPRIQFTEEEEMPKENGKLAVSSSTESFLDLPRIQEAMPEAKEQEMLEATVDGSIKERINALVASQDGFSEQLDAAYDILRSLKEMFPKRKGFFEEISGDLDNADGVGGVNVAAKRLQSIMSDMLPALEN
ncbi:MAG: hypothetical protein E7015_03505 [Alphaproteobacteria bacterium]|nr:hypothetical protein [Alphaproteobacteria bacterium]